MSEAAQGSAKVAAAVLREMLENTPRYRQRWQRRTARWRGGINQAGVARVVEDYLIESGEWAEDSPASFRRLKDRISRALGGERMSLPTVRLFVNAFGMNEDDETRLLAATSMDSLIGGGVSGTLRRRREMIRRQDHRTVSIVERYIVGPAGSLVARRTLQTIMATDLMVDAYIFNHENQAADIDVVHGGRIGRSFTYGGGLTAVEILLDRPLSVAETTALEYRTEFFAGTEVNEVRRAAFRKVEHVDFAVEFDPGRIPRAVWWSAWDDHIGGRVVREEPVPLHRLAARKYVPFVEESVVGFRWAW